MKSRSISAVEVADTIIARYSDEIVLTNLTLNILAYYVQVESLRHREIPLIADGIEVWESGPVEREIYAKFRVFGHQRIRVYAVTSPIICDEQVLGIIDRVISLYGWMTVFDLLNFVQRHLSAWHTARYHQFSAIISRETILASADFYEYPNYRESIKYIIDQEKAKHRKALETFGEY